MAPGTVAAQSRNAAAGAVLGTAGGMLVTFGLVTAQARTGRYLFSEQDLSWQLLPVGLGGVAGGLLGFRNGNRLGGTVKAGAWGLAAGALMGSVVGRLAWSDPAGTWAGAVMGASAGLVAGSLIGALTWDAEDPPVVLTLRLRR